MGNLHKKQRKEFEKFARKLPPFLINSHEKHILTGQELLDWGFTMDPMDETKKIDPGKKYLYKQPLQTVVDHVRRMHKAFDQHGPAGVNDYLMKLAKKLNATAIIKEDVQGKPEGENIAPKVDAEPQQSSTYIVKENPGSFMGWLSNVLHGD